MPIFKAIAAMSQNRVIGRDQCLPWHLPEELQWFRQTTLHQTLVMGRKTFESMGCRPLPDRTTYVLTKQPIKKAGVFTIANLQQLPASIKTVWICGGATVYAQFLPQCVELLLSVIQQEVEGDAFFPPFEKFFRKEAIVKKTADFEVQRWVSREVPKT